jgi:hypothetical protein
MRLFGQEQVPACLTGPNNRNGTEKIKGGRRRKMYFFFFILKSHEKLKGQAGSPPFPQEAAH